ncbi:unnamed protein product, partial [Ectocarpus fasciculatus]
AGVPLGCRAVQERVREQLLVEEEGRAVGEGGSGRRPLASRELEDVVVRACLVPVGGVPSPEQVSPMEFMFAGQRRVVVSATTRTTAAQQALFEGDEEGRSLATLVLDCLRRCPRDCRRALVQNVLVAGGGALLPGLPARLAQEIEALATADADAASAVPPLGSPEGYSWARAAVCGDPGGLCVARVPVRRDNLVWTGASIMASLGGIADRSLTCEQYLARRGEGGGRLLPDWMSVSSADWLFEGGGAAAAAVYSK